MKSLRKHVVGLVVVFTSTTLLAQPAPTADPTAPTVDATAAVGGQVTATLSQSEMDSRITELDQQTEVDAGYVLRLQIKARQEKDVIKLNCINDKLLQLKAMRNRIEEAKGEFVTASDDDERSHQFSLITVSAENIRTLKEEAQACAGEGELYGLESKSSWQGPDIPDDPSDNPFPDDIEDPGYASPFR